MSEELQQAIDRIRRYKNGERAQEVWKKPDGTLGSRQDYLEDLCFVADFGTTNENQRDAARYRWLRSQHWSESTLAVVSSPRDSVKLGRDCPSDERLDWIIDEAMHAAPMTESNKPNE